MMSVCLVHERNYEVWAHKGATCFTGVEQSMACHSAHMGLRENKEKRACGRWAAALTGLQAGNGVGVP